MFTYFLSFPQLHLGIIALSYCSLANSYDFLLFPNNVGHGEKTSITENPL